MSAWPMEVAGVTLAGLAAAWDLRTGRIPNRLVLPAAALGLVLNAAFGGTAGALRSATGAIVAALVPWGLYRASGGRAIGGGDVKLFAALGALHGPLAALEVELSACVLLGTYALVAHAYRGGLLRVLGNAARLLLNPLLPTARRRHVESEALTSMRMGPAIAAAVCYLCAVERGRAWVSWLV
jgi:prepilin peptidase CpaA